MEQYIPYSLICDLFSRNLESFTLFIWQAAARRERAGPVHPVHGLRDLHPHGRPFPGADGSLQSGGAGRAGQQRYCVACAGGMRYEK